MLAQEIGSIPVVLGTPGTILLSLVTLASGITNAYQWKKSATAQQWRGAAEAHKANLDAVRERAERVDEENKVLRVLAAELKAKTDLSSLERQNLEADRRNQEVHERIVIGQNTLLSNTATRSAEIVAALSENTAAIQQMVSGMKQEFEMHRLLFTQMTDALRSMKER